MNKNPFIGIDFKVLNYLKLQNNTIDQLSTLTIDLTIYNMNSYDSSGNPLNYLNYTVLIKKYRFIS